MMKNSLRSKNLPLLATAENAPLGNPKKKYVWFKNPASASYGDDGGKRGSDGAIEYYY